MRYLFRDIPLNITSFHIAASFAAFFFMTNEVEGIGHGCEKSGCLGCHIFGAPSRCQLDGWKDPEGITPSKKRLPRLPVFPVVKKVVA